MKFLIMSTRRPGLPRPDDVQAAHQAAWAYLNDLQAQGVADCVYFRAVGGEVRIVNADSHEALWAKLRAYPLYSLFEWQIEVLVDVNYVFETVLSEGQA